MSSYNIRNNFSKIAITAFSRTFVPTVVAAPTSTSLAVRIMLRYIRSNGSTTDFGDTNRSHIIIITSAFHIIIIIIIISYPSSTRQRRVRVRQSFPRQLCTCAAHTIVTAAAARRRRQQQRSAGCYRVQNAVFRYTRSYRIYIYYIILSPRDRVLTTGDDDDVSRIPIAEHIYVCNILLLLLLIL